MAGTQQVGTINVQQLASLNSGNIQIGRNAEGSNTFQRIVFSRSGAAGVDLVQVDSNVEERQPILSLPKSEGNNQLRVSIHAPESKDEKVTIILHKAA